MIEFNLRTLKKCNLLKVGLCKNILPTFILLFILKFNFFAQDSILKGRRSIGFVPILSFDNDLGIRYGGVFNYFKYDDSSFNYSENLFVRAFNSTKKSFQIQSVYETDHLLTCAKVFIEGSYLNDRAYDFFGFNGEAKLNPAHVEKHSPFFIHENYYKIHRELIRFRFDYQRYLTSNKFRLLAGFTFNKLSILQKATDLNLYSDYHQFGFIKENEKLGGYVNYITLGLVYEDRDNQVYCNDGNWFESFMLFSPKSISHSAFSKFILNWRLYKKIASSKNILMLRTSLQGRVSGEIPSFYNSVYTDTKLSQDGLGGAFNLRGYSRNSLVSSGFGLLNLEIRRNVYEFVFKDKQIDVECSVFSDQALVLQKYAIRKDHLTSEILKFYFQENAPNYYLTIGLGTYLVLNKNSVISINYGVPLGIGNDSKGAIYIGSSFLF